MISTKFYNGQGLGNQLWCYVTARVIAKDRGCDFGLVSPELFKGHDFMPINLGEEIKSVTNYYQEKEIIHSLNGSDIRTYDADLVNVPNGTQIDGYMQDEQYIAHRKNEIREWLRIRPEFDCRDYSDESICIINFRGGGYAFDVDFFLPQRYWDNAIAHMRNINPNFRFVVVTDDVKTAKKFFPDFEVNHWNIGKDYAVIKNAKYLILSNSSFAWFPAWLSEDLKFCIAPKYWARHNISDGYWSLGYNLTQSWMYLDRKGDLSGYDSCASELADYMKRNEALYTAHSGKFKKTIVNRIKNNWQIFKAIRNDVTVIYALIWLFRARGLRSAIWIKDNITRTIRNAKKFSFITRKNSKRIVKKILKYPNQVIEAINEIRLRKMVWLAKNQIAEYRKKIKIYDVFPFFNELDLLEIRLNILDPYVDYFVIVEYAETFSGNKKKLHFEENKNRYKKWAHKIIHHVIDDIPQDDTDMKKRLSQLSEAQTIDRETLEYCISNDTIDHSKPYWVKECYMKESIRKALVGLNDADVCYLSDLDEIWNPKLVIDYSQDSYFKPRQLPYMYYLNNRSDEDWMGWSGTVVTKYKNIKARSLNDIRSLKGKTAFTVLRNGGWHFNFQGGIDGARRKITEADHPFYGNKKYIAELEDAITKNIDHRGKNVKLWVDESDLPQYLLENKEKYKAFFK
ncbi:MAG: hypothetical protein V4524_02700 [Patescibacteria group bacterium]